MSDSDVTPASGLGPEFEEWRRWAEKNIAGAQQSAKVAHSVALFVGQQHAITQQAVVTAAHNQNAAADAAQLIPAAPVDIELSTEAYWDSDGAARASVTILADEVQSDDGDVPQYLEVASYEVWVRLYYEDPTPPDDGTDMPPAPPYVLMGTNTAPSIVVSPLDVNTHYQFIMRGISTAGVAGDFCDPVDITTTAALPAMAAPSAPTVTSVNGVVNVAWDGLMSDGAPPVQFSGVFPEWSTSQAGTYTQAGQNLLLGLTSVIPGLTIGDTVWVHLVGIDRLNQRTAASAAVSVVVTGVDLGSLESDVAGAISDAQAAGEAGQAAAATAQAAADAADSAAISRGTDLVTNGTGYLGNNTNFSTFTFDADAPAGAVGSFRVITDSWSGFTDTSFPIDTNKQYLLRAQVKAKNAEYTYAWAGTANSSASNRLNGAGAIDRTNLCLNPNAVGAQGFNSNNGTNNQTTYNVAISGHPQGITTAAKSVIKTGIVNSAILSMYNVDSLGNSSVSRYQGTWAMVTGSGYIAYWYSDGQVNAVPLTANVWRWVPSQTPTTTYASFNIVKGDGSTPPTTDTAYVTGVEVETVPFDPTLQTIWGGRPAATGSHFYVGLAPLDAYGLGVDPRNYSYITGTDATTTAAVNPGDTVINLSSTAGWTTGTYFYIGFWNYVDQGGRVWPQHTYTRNYAAFNSATVTSTTITLSAPWAGPTIPSGTPVSRTVPGGQYMYVAASNATATSAWTAYQGTVLSGVSNGANGAAVNQFPPGTAQAKILFLANRDVAGAQQMFAGISFSDAQAAQLTANGKNQVTYALTSPSSPGAALGDEWWQYSGVSNALLGYWRWDGVAWQSQQLTNATIATLDAGKITTGFLAAGRIAASTITGSMVVARTLTAVNILAGTITANEIAAATITSAKIAAGTIVAGNIAAGTITTNEIKAGTITANNIAAGTITTALLAATAINGMTITGAQIQTAAAANSGIKLTSSGLLGYDGSGNQTFKLDAATGVLTATSGTFTGTVNATGGTISGDLAVTGSLTGGTVQTATSGDRIILGPTGLRFQASDVNTLALQASSFGATSLYSGIQFAYPGSGGAIVMMGALGAGYLGANLFAPTAYFNSLLSDSLQIGSGSMRAFAAGELSTSSVAVNSAFSANVTFPSGRFTSVPKVFMNTGSGRLNTAAPSRTTSGFTFIANNWSPATASADTGFWFAVDAT